MSAWLALVLTDVVAVATFARCFTGPGELTAALVTLLLVHLVGLEARGGMSALRVDRTWWNRRAGSRGEPEHPASLPSCPLGTRPGRGSVLADRDR